MWKPKTKEELVSCRLDHYQTPMQVHVSAFAKRCFVPFMKFDTGMVLMEQCG